MYVYMYVCMYVCVTYLSLYFPADTTEIINKHNNMISD